MKLYFFDLQQYDTLKEANDAKATRCQYLNDEAAPSLKRGAACDIKEAVIAAANMIDGRAAIQFVLTDDEEKILDVF